jgi:DNA-binding IclR family transcriptional regulator
MSSLLSRSDAILRVLAANPGETTGVRRIAAKTGMPAATCSRILGQLARLGWVDQDGVRGGFRLGQAIYSLANGDAHATSFPQGLLDLLTALAVRHQAAVLVVSLQSDRRIIRYSIRPTVVSALIRNEDHLVYGTASGRLLLALLPPTERSRLIRQLGLPTRWSWPGVLTMPELQAELRAIRRDRAVAFRQNGYAAAAVPMPGPGGPPCALAAYSQDPTADPAALLAGLRSTLEAIAGVAASSTVPAPRGQAPPPR